MLLVTALMATTALGIDLMLPAFPDIRAEFGMAADSTKVAWIITAYFLGMAVGPWCFGPASDRFGRRTPLRAGLVLYGLSSAVAALAPSWPLVVASRFLWGIGAAGPRSLSIAMVMQDTKALLDFAAMRPAASKGPAGAVGYCMSGRYAVSAAIIFSIA